MSAREGTGALDRAIEAVVGTIGRFSGKDATSYLASYYPILWVSTFDSLTVIRIRGLRCAKVSFKEASSSRERI